MPRSTLKQNCLLVLRPDSQDSYIATSSGGLAEASISVNVLLDGIHSLRPNTAGQGRNKLDDEKVEEGTIL